MYFKNHQLYQLVILTESKFLSIQINIGEEKYPKLVKKILLKNTLI